MTALIALGACSPAGQNAVTRLGADPVLTGGTYSTGGGLTVASELREINGKTGLCGVWSESASQVALTRSSARGVLSKGSAYIGDEKLLTDLKFLRKAAPTTTYAGLPSGCIITARPWQASDATSRPILRLPQQNVYRDAGESGGQVITFRQTGPGAFSRSLDPIKTFFNVTQRQPLGPRPVQGGGRYSSGGGLSLAVELRNIDGAAYVCGVWAQTTIQSPHTVKQAPEILARSAVLVEDRRVISDLRFLRQVAPRQALAGRSANCMDIGLPWAEADPTQPVTLGLPNHTVYPGPGRAIQFIPGGPGA